MTAPKLPDTGKKTSLHDIKDDKFEFIVVGGGTSGCLLASRLAAAPVSHRHKVLLVEAGGAAEEDLENLIPGLVVPKFGNEAGNWLYQTAPQKELNGRTIVYPRGRGLGGSSANNFSSWCRGPECDFDDWAAAVGDDWWRWGSVVEHMKELEDFHAECPPGMEKYIKPAPNMHHTGGAIAVGTGAKWQPLIQHCLQAAQEAGHKLNLDHNDGDPMGIAVAQMNVDAGVRRSSAAAFLGADARGKLDNLTVVHKTLCKRILFEGKRAVGVELFSTTGDSQSTADTVAIQASKDVVLCAGTFETPHILLMSGVGPADDLEKHGINVVHDHPYVGKNIRDHCAFSIEAVIDSEIPGHNQLLRNPEALAAARKEYEQSQTGPLAVFGASAAVLFARIPDLYDSDEFKHLPEKMQAFLSRSERPSTELWLHGGPLFYQGPVETNDSIIAIEGLCQNLLSKGSLCLQSADPRQLPLIDPAYCTEPYDWRIAIETIKLQLRIAKTPAMQAIIRKPLHGPGKRNEKGILELCDVHDEEAIRKFLREELTQGFHSMGSCVMGSTQNKERVVDAQFKVVGLDGLRIVDMSVCPILTNNHTQINAYLIAERCAQLMLDSDNGC